MMSPEDPLKTVVGPLEDPRAGAPQEIPSAAFDATKNFLATVSPEAGETLSRFSPEEFSELDAATRAWSSGLADLPALSKRLKGNLEIGWDIFNGYLTEWLNSPEGEPVTEQAREAEYKRRSAVGKKIAQLIEDA